ncbi:hypothetical protein ERD78_18845 [Allopusillimonas soli]|uniref:Uncharacterized protein n=1 Tax=Allopusillimonas soli TaxID=659016 RepID=A0A853FDD5_9BURK|nr:hypothetical protein [Allopusillimonas soli]NYT38874.1 hypothetical protein [Allopusillimonas soli]TEA70127.1 hypothetical protein ERD78_18845 [Allopusillimonas soli]
MIWDNSRFDRAFERIGVRERVYLVREGEPDQPFMARFDRPQEYVLDGQAHTTDYSIEFTTSEMPNLTLDSQVRIHGQLYRVNNEPLAQGDGYWTIATLEALS